MTPRNSPGDAAPWFAVPDTSCLHTDISSTDRGKGQRPFNKTRVHEMKEKSLRLTQINGSSLLLVDTYHP